MCVCVCSVVNYLCSHVQSTISAMENFEALDKDWCSLSHTHTQTHTAHTHTSHTPHIHAQRTHK